MHACAHTCVHTQTHTHTHTHMCKQCMHTMQHACTRTRAYLCHTRRRTLFNRIIFRGSLTLIPETGRPIPMQWVFSWSRLLPLGAAELKWIWQNQYVFEDKSKRKMENIWWALAWWSGSLFSVTDYYNITSGFCFFPGRTIQIKFLHLWSAYLLPWEVSTTNVVLYVTCALLFTLTLLTLQDHSTAVGCVSRSFRLQ